MGFLDADGALATSPRGKALRPALALLSASAVGAEPDRGLAAAAALELVHDFTLLHDDVMDDDRERRHRPTAWTVFGVGAAICAGDALILLARQVLHADASPHRHVAGERLDDATLEVIAGQARDLALEGRVDVSVEEYLEMSAGKTGALLGCAASLGAVLAGGEDAACAHLEAFGRALGLAFQAVDDWLGVWGDPGRTGKPIANDLRQRKSALPLVLALASDSEGVSELRQLMEEPEDARPIEDRTARAFTLIDRTDAETATLAEARLRMEQARRHLDAAEIDAGVRADLLEIAEFVVAREF